MFRSTSYFQILSTALVCVLLVLSPATSNAKIVLGDCEGADETTCIRPLIQILTAKEVEKIRNSPKPENIGSVHYNALTGEITHKPLAALRGVDQIVDNHPEPILPENTLAASNGKGLTKVSTPWTDFPYRAMVKLVMTFPNGQAWCSGTMIGRHTVFTAGHCVFATSTDSDDLGGWATSIDVIPAMANMDWTRSDYLSPYGKSSMVSVAASAAWVNSKDFRYDTAIIKLNQNIGDITGKMQLEWDQSSYSGTINFAGYPGAEGYDGYWLYKTSTNIAQSDRYNICHYENMVQGQSGGPAWFYYGGTGQYAVVAANSYGYDTGNGWMFCHGRYNAENEADRAEFENQSAATPTNAWICDIENFNSGDGCHCNCGHWDYDCDTNATNAENCDGSARCNYPGTCACTPDCSGDRECGFDGCGGNCGTCPPSKSYCDDGTCVIPDCNDVCDWRECGNFDNCNCGTCGSSEPYCSNNLCSSTDCNQICDTRECGTFSDCDCGSCSSGYTCENGTCKGGSGTCTGSCTGDAIFCIEESICACYQGNYIQAGCQQICIDEGYSASAGCDKNPDTGNDVCYCSNMCPGYTGTNACCTPENPCNWDSNGSCQCGGSCNWDVLDCNAVTDGDTEPDGDTTPTDGDDNPAEQCQGACSPLDTPFCIDDSTLCKCSTLSWNLLDCQNYCSALGRSTIACAFDLLTSQPNCVCGDPTLPDGDTNIPTLPDGDTTLPDGDDDSGSGLVDSVNSGCNTSGTTSSSTGSALMLCLLTLAVILRRKENLS